ncbi:PAS domain-containing protein [Hyphobacterium sp. HN65]|uniref:histidine kinase n=1 Tax=Hyphobacterium lacteum TaxID=3116575 RepID=A0ABU7LP10_9PROT|nr:PAS domain-containing protein [Hyphobacterium sp. HN65]MEE2525653.1 PAS domain-containing protein [Hyphobacterium sp. HN65]
MTSKPSPPEPYSADAQQMFVDALDSSGETAWRLDFASMTLEVAGPSVPEMFGIRSRTHQMPMSEWRARLTPESVPRCEACLADLKAWGIGSTELTFVAANGREIVLLDRGRVTRRQEGGEPQVATGLFTDMTEQRALERRFDEVGAFLTAAMEAADLATWRFDFARNIAVIDGPLMRHIQMETDARGEVTGEHWSSFAHPEDLDEIIRGMQAMADGRTSSVDVIYRLRDDKGAWRWIHSFGRVTRHTPDGKGLLAVGILKDETENVRLREQLEASKGYFETIVRKAPAMIHQTDGDGTIMSVSDFWLQFMGYERGEVIGRNSAEFLTPESKIYAETHAFPEFLRKGETRNVSVRFRKKNGEVFDALFNGRLIKNPAFGETHGIAVISDVSQLRKAFRNLERSNRELDRFATVASHDLQEPLRKIGAFAHLLRSRHSAALDDDGISCLDFLLDAANRMQDMIDSLLEYSQIEVRPLRPQPISMIEIVDEVRHRLADRIKDSGAVIKVAGDDALEADRFLLGQILQNLISNAIKYRSDRDPEILIHLSVNRAQFELTVTDNGIGFDPKFADQVFEPFRRLHPRGEFDGAGIGLAIVRQAVDRQGGAVSVESQQGKGTMFAITLPCSKGDEAAA